MKAVLSTEVGLDFVDGDRELYISLLETYIEDNQFDKKKLLDLVNAVKWEEAQARVHRLKGASAQIGAQRLANTTLLLERVLTGKEEGDAQELVRQTAAQFEETLSAIRAVLVQWRGKTC